jgi:hypothetical protein
MIFCEIIQKWLIDIHGIRNYQCKSLFVDKNVEWYKNLLVEIIIAYYIVIIAHQKNKSNLNANFCHRCCTLYILNIVLMRKHLIMYWRELGGLIFKKVQVTLDLVD